MREENPVKHLVIEMEYRTVAELDQALTAIKNQVKLGVQEYKKVHNGVRYEYGMCYLQEFGCRLENINGVECIVIPSKMNENL